MAPVAANPAPDKVDALIVTAEVPVEERMSVCVAIVVTATSPKFTLDELRFRIGPEAFSCIANVSDTPLALAVRVAAWLELAGEMDAVKVALAAPAGTVTVPGTVTNELLLTRFSENPPLAAAALSATTQLSVPDPAIEAMEQLRELSTGTPVPFRPIEADDPTKASLVRVSWPATCPEA